MLKWLICKQYKAKWIFLSSANGRKLCQFSETTAVVRQWWNYSLVNHINWKGLLAILCLFDYIVILIANVVNVCYDTTTQNNLIWMPPLYIPIACKYLLPWNDIRIIWSVICKTKLFVTTEKPLCDPVVLSTSNNLLISLFAASMKFEIDLA